MADTPYDMIGSLGSSVIGAISGGIQNRKNRKFQKEMQEDAQAFTREERLASQDWAYQMWNENNAYNTAGAQIGRMVEAGINPNNAAAALAGVSGSSTVGTPSYSGSGIAGAPANYRISDNIPDLGMVFNELANIKADTKKTEEEAEGQSIANELDKRNLARQDIVDEQYKESLRKTIAEANLTEKQQDVADALIKKYLSEKALTEDERKECQERTKTYAQNMKESDARIAEIQQKIATLKKQREVMQSTMDLQSSATELNNMEADLADAKTERQQLQNDYEIYLQNCGSSIDEPKHEGVAGMTYDTRRRQEVYNNQPARRTTPNPRRPLQRSSGGSKRRYKQ